MNEQYFPKLMKLLGLSALIFIVSSAPIAPPFLSVLGIGPLVYYHLKILVPASKDGLSPTGIDSVYYFGFLITVVALAISAIHIAGNAEQTRIGTVVLHFGLGLFATGYAVFARMHLNSLVTATSVLSEEEILDRYVQRSAKLVEHIETSTTKLASFATEIIARTAASAEVIQQTAEQNMRRTSEGFAKDIAKILGEVHGALNGIQQLVTDPSTQAARARFNTELRDTYQASSQLNASMGELAKRTAEESQQRADTIAATKNLALHLQDFSRKVQTLSAADGAFALSAQTLGEISGGLQSSTRTVVHALNELKEVGRLVQDTGPTFVKMRTLTKKATEQLETLAEVTDHFRTAGENVQFAADASEALNVELSRMRDIFPTLSASGKNLTSAFDTAERTTRGLEERIAALPQGLDAVHALRQSMTLALNQVTEDLRNVTEHVHQVRESSASEDSAANGAGALLDGAARLDDTVASILQRLADLLEAIGSVNAAIQETSEGLKSYATHYKSTYPTMHSSVLPLSVSPQPGRTEETLP